MNKTLPPSALDKRTDETNDYMEPFFGFHKSLNLYVMTETAETPQPDDVVDAIFMKQKGDRYNEIDSYPVEWKELKEFKAVRE